MSLPLFSCLSPLLPSIDSWILTASFFFLLALSFVWFVQVPPGLLPVSEEDRLAAAEEKLEQLLILANDAEANGDYATALLRHEDRVAVAAKALGPSTDGPNATDPHEKKVRIHGTQNTQNRQSKSRACNEGSRQPSRKAGRPSNLTPLCRNHSR